MPTLLDSHTGLTGPLVTFYFRKPESVPTREFEIPQILEDAFQKYLSSEGLDLRTIKALVDDKIKPTQERIQSRASVLAHLLDIRGTSNPSSIDDGVCWFNGDACISIPHASLQEYTKRWYQVVDNEIVKGLASEDEILKPGYIVKNSAGEIELYIPDEKNNFEVSSLPDANEGTISDVWWRECIRRGIFPMWIGEAYETDHSLGEASYIFQRTKSGSLRMCEVRKYNEVLIDNNWSTREELLSYSFNCTAKDALELRVHLAGEALALPNENIPIELIQRLDSYSLYDSVDKNIEQLYRLPKKQLFEIADFIASNFKSHISLFGGSINDMDHLMILDFSLHEKMIRYIWSKEVHLRKGKIDPPWETKHGKKAYAALEKHGNGVMLGASLLGQVLLLEDECKRPRWHCGPFRRSALVGAIAHAAATFLRFHNDDITHKDVLDMLYSPTLDNESTGYEFLSAVTPNFCFNSQVLKKEFAASK